MIAIYHRLCARSIWYAPALILLLALVTIGWRDAAYAAPTPPEEWPEWRGPHRNGALLASPPLTDAWPAGAKKLWQTGIGGGFGSPIVAAGKLYVTGDNKLFCLDATSGTMVWQTTEMQGAGESHSTPCFANGRIYVVLRGIACCYDAVSGKELWKGADLGKNLNTPGRQDIHASPLVVGNIAIFNGNGILRAFDASTGKEIWNQPKGAGVNSLSASPTRWDHDGKTDIIQNTNDGQICVDSQSGAVKWCEGRGSGFQSPAVAGDIEIGGSNNGGDGVAAWRLTDAGPQKLWEVKLGNCDSSVSIYAGCVYAFAEKEFACIQLDNGKVLWRQPIQAKFSSAVIADGKLFFITWGQGLAAYKVSAAKCEPLGNLVIEGGGCTTPALVQGKLYVRVNTPRAVNNNAMACYDISKQ